MESVVDKILPEGMQIAPWQLALVFGAGF